MKGYDLFLLQLDEVLAKFPKLSKKSNQNCKVILQGELDVIDIYGKLWESYLVEIHCSENFPYRFPLLYEVGDKIPKIADWHIFEDTNSCCVKILPEEIISCKDGISLLTYIEEEALPYLFNQTHRRLEGYYVNGEYSHGTTGIYEFYSSVLDTANNVRKTIELILYIAEKPKLYRTNYCFCGSGFLYRKCHRKAYEHLILIGKETLKKHALRIAKSYGLI